MAEDYSVHGSTEGRVDIPLVLHEDRVVALVVEGCARDCWLYGFATVQGYKELRCFPDGRYTKLAATDQANLCRQTHDANAANSLPQ